MVTLSTQQAQPVVAADGKDVHVPSQESITYGNSPWRSCVLAGPVTFPKPFCSLPSPVLASVLSDHAP